MELETLQALLDIRSITDQLSLWCRIRDSLELSRMSEVFDNDVAWDYGQGITENSLEGVVRKISGYVIGNESCGASHHHIANIRVDVRGDEAESEAYFFAVQAGAAAWTGKTLMEWGNYRDFWQRKTQGWRIVRRLYQTDITAGPAEIIFGSRIP